LEILAHFTTKYYSADSLELIKLNYIHQLKPQYNPKSPHFVPQETITTSISRPTSVSSKIVLSTSMPTSPKKVSPKGCYSPPLALLPPPEKKLVLPPPVVITASKPDITLPAVIFLSPPSSQDNSTTITNNLELVKISIDLPQNTPKTWTLSEATRLKQSLARQKREKESELRFKVQVQDLITQKTIIYDNLSKAALALNINKGTLSRRLQQGITKAYKKRYIITKL
jgi:hypothetical protein